jgi:hypothetical protein
VSEYDTSYDARATALHSIAAKAIEKLNEVVEVYTTQLRLIEVECRDLNQQCGSLGFKLNATKEDLFNCRAEVCRFNVGKDDSAETLQKCAEYAYTRKWDDVGKCYEDWAKRKNGGAA